MNIDMNQKSLANTEYTNHRIFIEKCVMLNGNQPRIDILDRKGML